MNGTRESLRVDQGCATRRRVAGFTFVEIAVTVVLMGTVVVSMLAATQTSIITSSQARAAARVETVVVNVADRVNRARKGCDYLPYAQAAVSTERWDISSVSVSQWHLAPGADSGDLGTWVPNACPDGFSEPPDLLVQRVAITVISPDRQISRSIEVLKSDV